MKYQILDLYNIGNGLRESLLSMREYAPLHYITALSTVDGQ